MTLSNHGVANERIAAYLYFKVDMAVSLAVTSVILISCDGGFTMLSKGGTI